LERGVTLQMNMATRSTFAYFNLLPPNSEDAIHIGSIRGNDLTGTVPASGRYWIRVY
jgi:hypothetical protein